MRPQDVVVQARILLFPNDGWSNLQIARDLSMSASEVGQSLERCKRARLIDSEKRVPMRHAFLEFIVHGLSYVFPAVVGPMTRGLPTAHSAPPLDRLITQGAEPYVWPWSRGESRGQSILPLYSTVPESAAALPALHEFLALVDALRIGRARERNLAAELLEQRILARDRA